MTPNKIKFNKSLWPYFLVNLDKLYIKICPNISSFWEEKKITKTTFLGIFLSEGFFTLRTHMNFCSWVFFSILTIWTFMPLFSSGQNLKKTFKKKDFRKIKGVRGNSEVSTIDKSVFAPFFLFINFFWFFLSQNV